MLVDWGHRTTLISSPGQYSVTSVLLMSFQDGKLLVWDAFTTNKVSRVEPYGLCHVIVFYWNGQLVCTPASRRLIACPGRTDYVQVKSIKFRFSCHYRKFNGIAIFCSLCLVYNAPFYNLLPS